MIKNEKQLNVVKSHLQEFESTRKGLERKRSGRNDVMLEGQIDVCHEKITQLNKKIEEYTRLKSGNMKEVYMTALDEIPHIIIKSRLAHGWTQEQLAEKLHVKAQQVQRWEANDYETISFTTLMDIADVLDITIVPTTVLLDHQEEEEEEEKINSKSSINRMTDLNSETMEKAQAMQKIHRTMKKSLLPVGANSPNVCSIL